MLEENGFMPIMGHILLRGYRPIASFAYINDAMEVQRVMARANRGESFTLIGKDYYSTTCIDRVPEEEGESKPT